MEQQKIDLLSMSIMITEFCDLKCKLCLAYIPYYKEHQHMNVEQKNIK